MKRLGVLFISISFFVMTCSDACVNYTIKNKTDNKLLRATFSLAPKKASNEVVRVKAGEMQSLCGPQSGNLIVHEKQGEETITVCNYAISNDQIDSVHRQFGSTCPNATLFHHIITFY